MERRKRKRLKRRQYIVACIKGCNWQTTKRYNNHNKTRVFWALPLSMLSLPLAFVQLCSVLSTSYGLALIFLILLSPWLRPTLSVKMRVINTWCFNSSRIYVKAICSGGEFTVLFWPIVQAILRVTYIVHDPLLPITHGKLPITHGKITSLNLF